ncbi:PucR family transcriptional regulator [Acinetobacter venetianus]|uniref:PucR family transcriptional regulator n=1 Tax=Acinetobacter venetianus TaxID=52133 RepID=UPI00289DA091|nr:PucR family transcriptional regulator ligand-binding domain-containing protein [Acinetobacter venetianus]
MSMTVQEVLELPQLYELRLRAGADHVHRLVRWFYVAENEGISDWIEGGELVFITGINQVRDEANLLDLLDQAATKNVAGIVILTGTDFIREIPATVLEKADTLGLPLIEQPYHLKLVELTHVIGTRLVQLSQIKKSAEDVVSQLLLGQYPSLETIQLRAQQLGLPLLGQHVVAVVRLSNVQDFFQDSGAQHKTHDLYQKKQACYEHLESWRKQHEQVFPIVPQGEQFSLVLSLQEQDLNFWFQALSALVSALRESESDLKLYVGLSTEVNSAVAFQRGYWEACQAEEIAADLKTSSGVCLYNELGVLRLIKAIPNKAVTQQLMNETLGCLIEPEKKQPYLLIETLDAWLKESGNAIQAAARLGIHRNTLNQRIQKIEALTGQSLGNPNFRLNASVALLIWQISHD